MFRLILLSLGQLDKTLHLTTTHKTHEGLLLFKYTPYFFLNMCTTPVPISRQPGVSQATLITVR